MARLIFFRDFLRCSTHEPAPPLSTPPFSLFAVAVAGEPVAKKGADTDGKVMSYEQQEEGGCWCKVVEGIKAEGEAIIFGIKMVVQLSKVFFWVLPHYAGGGCIAGSIARRVHPSRPAPSASGWSTRRM